MKAGGHRYASAGSRRRRWMTAAAGIFALYCMFQLQMRLWSAASLADLRSNAISADRDPGVIVRPAIKHKENQQRATREDLGVAQQIYNVPAVNTHVVKTAAPVVHEQQNLRVVDPPLPIPGAVIAIAPEPSTTQAAAVFGAPAVSAQAAPAFADRHEVVSGYDAAIKYLASYRTPEGSDEQLFLFFVCGDKHGQQTTWRRVCVDASKVVYDVFEKSPSRNRLVTIHAGSKEDWSTPNAFFKDGDLKVKMIPAIMQWHGGRPEAKRATSGMIIEQGLLYEPLLRYLFKNEDAPDPLLAPDIIVSKEIVLLKGYKNFRLYMDAISDGENPSLTAPQGPMFLFLIAGRLESNDRLWCPYCRYSEISVEYAFYAFAPPEARLVKVETTNSYKFWKNPANGWKQDTALGVRGVPWMYRASLDTEAHAFSYARYHARFDRPDDLRGVFQGWKNPM